MIASFEVGGNIADHGIAHVSNVSHSPGYKRCFVGPEALLRATFELSAGKIEEDLTLSPSSVIKLTVRGLMVFAFGMYFSESNSCVANES